MVPAPRQRLQANGLQLQVTEQLLCVVKRIPHILALTFHHSTTSWPTYADLKNISVPWAKVVSVCNLWREWIDISDEWATILKIVDYQVNNHQSTTSLIDCLCLLFTLWRSHYRKR